MFVPEKFGAVPAGVGVPGATSPVVAPVGDTQVPTSGEIGRIATGLQAALGPIAEQRSLSSIGAVVSSDLINQAILVLERNGPAEGRPLVDTVTASRLPNMKELRPPSAGRTEIRILFVFDPYRSAVLLVAGDKSGQWNRWYRTAIPEAERLYEAYLDARKREQT